MIPPPDNSYPSWQEKWHPLPNVLLSVHLSDPCLGGSNTGSQVRPRMKVYTDSLYIYHPFLYQLQHEKHRARGNQFSYANWVEDSTYILQLRNVPSCFLTKPNWTNFALSQKMHISIGFSLHTVAVLDISDSKCSHCWNAGAQAEVENEGSEKYSNK